jgi:glycerol-3-phosphate cytidylyltransferase
MTKPGIILTCGSYDLFHFGHLNVLLKAKSLGTKLIVGVSTNALIKKSKGIGPVISYRDRVAIIKALKCVDLVVKQTTVFDINQFKTLKADYFVVGDDWRNRTDNPGLNWLKKHKKVIFIPYTKHLSSSKIKERIIRNAFDIIKAQVKK